jgi:predicted MPP superfamily phosphohydrolase
MRKHLLPILVTLLAAIVIADLIAYTVYDNARFTVTRQEVVVPGLPEAFNGFTILQVSDLHSTEFGGNESNLIAAINGLSYDLIAFTGDMQDRKGNLQPFLDLVRGIRHDGRPMLFVSGNSGPEDVDLKAGYVYDEGLRLQNEGLTLMDRPFSIERGGARLWFSEVYDGLTPAEMIRQARERIDSRLYPQMDSYYADQILYLTGLQGTFDGIKPDDTLIGITHYPLTKAQLDDPGRASLPFDLVIAGHYHGGQIRLPGIGALYVPAPAERRHGLFPNPRIVSGLYQGEAIQQYVSRGLGAGGPVPWLRFRLFNTPEINLIRLVSEK